MSRNTSSSKPHISSSQPPSRNGAFKNVRHHGGCSRHHNTRCGNGAAFRSGSTGSWRLSALRGRFLKSVKSPCRGEEERLTHWESCLSLLTQSWSPVLRTSLACGCVAEDCLAPWDFRGIVNCHTCPNSNRCHDCKVLCDECQSAAAQSKSKGNEPPLVLLFVLPQ